MSESNGKVCCNCRHCKRKRCAFRIEGAFITQTYCDVDNRYIGYVECMEGWCRHWAKEREVKDGKVRMD